MTTADDPNIAEKPEVPVTRLNRMALAIAVGVVCIISLLYMAVLRQGGESDTLPNRQVMNQKLEGSTAPVALLSPSADNQGIIPPPQEVKVTPEEEIAKKLHEQVLEENLKARTSPIAVSSFTAEIQKASAAISAVSPPQAVATAAADTSKADDDPNKQVRKESFLKNTNQDSTYLQAARTAALSPYEVKAGSQIPAVMISGINSDLPGMITAQVRESVYDTRTGKYLLIPQGAKLVGRYDSQVAYGQSRVLVVWERIIFPDTSSITLQNMAGSDTGGYAGFSDQVDNHYLRIFGSAILMSVIEAGAELSQPQTNNSTTNPTASQVVAASVGAQLAQTGNALLQKNLNIQPTLEVRPGYKFNVMVNKDMVLPGIYSPLEPIN